MQILIRRSNSKIKIVLLAFWSFFVAFAVQGGVEPNSNRPVSQIEIGKYPGSVAMPEATSRLNRDKPPTWIAAEAYHTNDSNMIDYSFLSEADLIKNL